jgi:hypothetical protein
MVFELVPEVTSDTPPLASVPLFVAVRKPAEPLPRRGSRSTTVVPLAGEKHMLISDLFCQVTFSRSFVLKLIILHVVMFLVRESHIDERRNALQHLYVPIINARTTGESHPFQMLQLPKRFQ